MSMVDEIEPSSPEAILTFYRHLYPFQSIFNWLNHEITPTRRFTHREFAFTLAGDVYLRYNSFTTTEDFKKQVLSLNPTRFEIGPVYSTRPRDKKTARPGAFYPVQRELVFDIDMTDYDDVRTCCSGAGVCKRCWGFIAAAVTVLDTGIREQYRYEHLLWVYSGRRGIHLWISDKEAMDLTDEQRRAIVGWFSAVVQPKEAAKRLNVRVSSGNLPPSIQFAVDQLADDFMELVVKDQDCFGREEGWKKLLEWIPDSKVVDKLNEEWSYDPERSSVDKWDDLKVEVRRYGKDSTERLVLKAAMEEIILQYTYPRLDANVSIHRNHLLKAPFCVHPKTGKVCVPVDPKKIKEFDLEAVPTVGQLLRELDLDQSASVGGEQRPDWERTSLKPYVDMLDKHCAGLMDETRRMKRDMSW